MTNVQKNRLLYITLLSSICFILNFSACSEGPNRQQDSSWEEFGTLQPTQGAKLCSTDQVCLIFSKGSTTTQRAFKLRKLSPEESGIPEEKRHSVVGAIYNIQSSKESFAKPFEIRLPLTFSPQGKTLYVAFWQKDKWIPVPSRISEDSKFVIGRTTHLSIWSILSACPQHHPSQCGEIKLAGQQWRLCADLKQDPEHCGSCGNRCLTGQVCMQGSCCAHTRCPVSGSSNRYTCIDTQKNNQHCGKCNSACSDGETCLSGVCKKPTCSKVQCGSKCVDTQTNPQHCGKCNNNCPTGQLCITGQCQLLCPTGTTKCTNACVQILSDPKNCGQCGRVCATGTSCQSGRCACPSGQTKCNGTCVHTSSDVKNCGRCNHQCSSGTLCSSGVCVKKCPTTQTKCGSTCADLQTNTAHCGKCQQKCLPNQRCSNGQCSCPTGQVVCAGRCVNTKTDLQNCGKCGTKCPSGQSCTHGKCVCPSGQIACAGRCVNAQKDPLHCGKCSNKCASGQSCTNGKCGKTCNSPLSSCGKECVNLQTELSHCGKCGNKCRSDQACHSGKCVCPAGQTDCNGTCIKLSSDPKNCGRCGNKCANGWSCQSGTCQLICSSGQSKCGNTCVDLKTDPKNCGKCSQQCTKGKSCTNGTCSGHWFTRAGGIYNNDYGQKITIDSLGNLYIIGRFEKEASFGSTTLTSTGKADVFIAKMNTGGGFIWAKSAGSLYDDYGTDIAVDGSGNVYITGTFGYFKGGALTPQIIKFGSKSLKSSGDADLFVAKMNAKGNFLWAKRAGGVYDDYSHSIAVDKSGSAYITGQIKGGASFDSIKLTGQTNAFIAKLSPTGGFLWAKRTIGKYISEGKALTADATGNTYVTGYFTTTMVMGSTTLTTAGSDGIFIAKLDTKGSFQWVQSIKDTNSKMGKEIQLDSSGNPYVAYLHGYGGSSYYKPTAHIAKFNTKGQLLWDKDAGQWIGVRSRNGLNSDISLAVDASGNAYITGYVDQYSLDVLYIAKIGSNGHLQWTGSSSKTTSSVRGRIRAPGMTIDKQGNYYVIGSLGGRMLIDTTTYASSGSYFDIFIAKNLPPANGQKFCSNGQPKCGSKGTCTDTQTDNNNCGGCGVRCPSGNVCVSGQCVCPKGLTRCGATYCTSLNYDGNCGGCGILCRGGFSCVKGSGGSYHCGCPKGTGYCGPIGQGYCVSFNSMMNCGGCNRYCPSPKKCVNQQCVN